MAGSIDAYPRTVCPFLGTRNEEGVPAPYVDCPSFENLCFVGGQPEPVMLTDQATFCLSSGHRHCPRLAESANRVVDRGRGPEKAKVGDPTAAMDSSDPLLHSIAEMEAALEAEQRAKSRRRRRWGWFGAAMIFVSSLVCGGLFAAYIGWQLVNTEAAMTQAGTITTLANMATPAPPSVYLIVTATSEPASAADSVTAPDRSQPMAFPPAVTATPAGNEPGAFAPATDAPSSQGAVQAVGVPTRIDSPSGGVATATPPFNMLVQIPTRRPTPVIDLAIAVPPAPQATTAPSPSPTPTPLGTPVVIFAAEDNALEAGDCTTVSWHVENVRAVYYENLGVDGQGEHEECIRDKPGDYTLTVILPNGSTKYYTVTVGLILPTKTPTPTATFPPEVVPTATWTPVIPTVTPTPDFQYGVLLSVDGSSVRSCVAGETCEVSLLLTNTSLTVDNISLLFLQSAAWRAQFCRMDGVCSDSRLTIASVGPSNTALVKFLVHVPKRASGKTASYTLRAVSEGSGGTAGSDAVTVSITGE